MLRTLGQYCIFKCFMTAYKFAFYSQLEISRKDVGNRKVPPCWRLIAKNSADGTRWSRRRSLWLATYTVAFRRRGGRGAPCRGVSARFHPGKATETLCKWVFTGRTFVGDETERRAGGCSVGLRGEGCCGISLPLVSRPLEPRRGIGQEAGSFLPKLNRKLDSH